MIARGGGAQLTPLTTRRDNRGTQGCYRKILLSGQVSLAAVVPGLAVSESLLRALVILRDGLTPALHWAHAFLCATSCLIGGDGLIGRIGAARLPRGYPRGNDQTIKHRGEAVMERSVTESPRAPKRQRIVRWVEGVLVGIAIFTLVVLGFDWLMVASP